MTKPEKTTREVADELGLSPDLIRKYKARGFLKKAPQGVSGQGRGVQCLWSEEAVDELRKFLKSPRQHGRFAPGKLAR